MALLRFGRDDDSIMQSLLTELDFETVKNHLQRVGYTYASSKAGVHAFVKSKREGLVLVMKSRRHFQFFEVRDGEKLRVSRHINTWDSWVVFLRELGFSSKLHLPEKK